MSAVSFFQAAQQHASQHVAAPIPNDIPWYYIAVAILIGSALVTYGAWATAENWEKDAKFPSWFSVVGGIVGIVLASLGGAIAGYLVWQWTLGLLCGIAGALASPWILRLIWSRFGKGEPPADPPSPLP